MSQKLLKNPDKENIQENYKVRERTGVEQFEKETTINTNKGKPQEVEFYSGIGSHIRKIIKNENDKIEITKVIVNEENKYIHAIYAKMPVDCMTISLKSSPKSSGSIGRLVSG